MDRGKDRGGSIVRGLVGLGVVGVSVDGVGWCVGLGGKDRDGLGVNRVGGVVVIIRIVGGVEVGGCFVRSVRVFLLIFCELEFC